LTPQHAALFAIVAIQALLALVLVFARPPWEAADELDHVRNVQTLAAGDLYEMEPGAGLEANQPPLYYALLAGLQRAFGKDPIRPVAVVNEPCARQVVRGEMPRCSLRRHDTPHDASDMRLVVLLRLPGIALGALTLVLTAAAVGRLSRDPWTPVVAAGVVAAVPRFTFVATSVTNDVLVNALAALATYLAALAVSRRGVENAPRVLIAVGLGVVAASLTLTKLTGVLLIPGLVLAVALSARGWREPLRLLAVFAGAALICSGWWLVRNVEQHGDPLAVRATEDYLRAEDPLEFALADSDVERAFVKLPQEMWSGFWYRSLQFRWSTWAYLPFWVFAAGGIAGLAFGKRKVPAGNRSPPSRAGLVVLGVLALAGLATLWVIGLRTAAAQARFVFVALPAIACLVALGLERARVPVLARFVLPVLGLAATAVAIVDDVIGVYR
jgi:4-amino-4-deoxy-L-arabinose transferase-like glycosyltransferase